MRTFNRLLILFYTVLFMLLGCILVALSVYQYLYQTDYSIFLEYLMQVQHLTEILGGVGIFLIFVSFSLASVAFKAFQKEKTIGFPTSFGNVIISLGAIEDYIRKITQGMPEVKELRSDVVVTRRGIEIGSRVALWSTSNITEVTEKLQTLIKGQVQTLLSGIEKPLLINVYVTKILQKEHAKKSPLEKPEDLPYIH